MYDSPFPPPPPPSPSHSSLSPCRPFFFFRMVPAKRSSTCTPAHARAFTLKFAHLYETSACTHTHTHTHTYATRIRVRLYVCKFNGSVRTSGYWKGLLSFFLSFFLPNPSRFPAALKSKENKLGDLPDSEINSQTFSYFFQVLSHGVQLRNYPSGSSAFRNITFHLNRFFGECRPGNVVIKGRESLV